MEERLARVETRVDAVEARVTELDRGLDRMVSKVGDAQMTASAVLSRLESLDRIELSLAATRETQAAQAAKTTIVLTVLGAVGVAVLGVLATLITR